VALRNPNARTDVRASKVGTSILDTRMDAAKRTELISRIKTLGLPSVDRPLPLVTLEEFFVGNDDYGSIGCNLTPMLGPQFFFEKLKFARSQAGVQDVLVEVTEVEEEHTEMWPFADRIYVLTNGTADDVARSTVALHPDAIEEGFPNGRPDCAPELMPGVKCYGVWWD
jgi:hypothetical protein